MFKANYLLAYFDLTFSPNLKSSLLVTDPLSDVIFNALGARIACWKERQTRDRKVASLNPGRSGWRIFFSRVNFVC